MTQRQVPPQRWQIFPAQKAQAKQIAQATALSPLLAQVLINRGIYTPEQAWEFLDPETLLLPSPLDEFPDLNVSLDLLVAAVETQQKILICGDYDADGMTSTALLMRSLRYLGAQVDYAIPSRMDEGYGINRRMVEDFHAIGGTIILTVDNGIAAYDPIARAKALGLTVIVTDHHEVPEKVPPADAILNPKLIAETSPYRSVAGVGVAYVLAVCLAQRMGKTQDLTATLLALFTLGTIADLAPLTGVNRRWVKRGLKLLPKSRIPGIQALIEVAGLSEETALKPEAIGFRLGPRINAVGRIADPQIVIDLLTTDDIGVALQRAMQCEETNKLRRQLCEIIEAQAVEWCEAQQEKGLLNLQKERVLVVVQPEWHHGVIGIVASRLVERYGVPVFIGTYEDKAQKEIRGSARSIPEFNVFEALQFCDDLLDRYGGHRAAGGFSFEANKLRQVKSRLSNFACKQLQPEHLKPLVTVDVQAQLSETNLDLFTQIDRIHPCGIENPDPVFWTANVTVVEQKVIGKTKAHLKLTVAHTAPTSGSETAAPEKAEAVVMKAIAWRWGEYYPLPRALDIAYRLRLNEWKDQRTVELELVGVRPATSVDHENNGIRPWSAPPAVTPSPISSTAPSLTPIAPPLIDEQPRVVKENAARIEVPEAPEAPEVKDRDADATSLHVEFYYAKRRYKGTLETAGQTPGQTPDQGHQLTIQNTEGHLLTVQMAARKGFLHLPDLPTQEIDIADLKYFNLIRAGLNALEVKQKTQLLIKKDDLLAEKDAQITTMKAQIELLEEKITQLSAEQQQQFADLKTELQTQEDTIQGQEAQIEQLQIQVTSAPVASSADIQRQVRDAIGDDVWFCLQAASQKDLQAAYKNYQMLDTSGPDAYIADYSEAGIRLSFAIEREILKPFFADFADFARQQGITEVGGVALNLNGKYTLGMMPALVADQWRSFPPGELSQQQLRPEGVSIIKVKAKGRISGRDRALINQFFAQWDHPMSGCLSQKSGQAASSLDQIGKLRNIAAHGESFLYRWQYELMHQLITGQSGKGGLLRQIFS
ncbi:MAG: single-stranded-DNA-specific exonuclease RecJ [Phormidesmis priestleyi]|uniref:Single-stranded-DNA-specific exonuclease RecJ n=1 Tax=Phormidesmis priestleyi TaxID=268141 RepID=A0A2W4ZDH8_9CYAN|nr:MAG: single-stranded-DNA-specific exonuclease RecJ [Phormidesmis priestleyi]